jgi:hypothetical protein
MADQGDGFWLHAIGRSLDPRRLTGLTGVGGRPVRTVRSAGLDAVVSPVDLAEFGEEALRRNLEEIAWLESTARAHHRVVAAAGGLGPVVPARLATVYRGAAGIAGMLAERRPELSAALARITGRDEWGVKAFAVPDMSVTAAAPAAGGGGGTAGAGSAYLRRRRDQLAARETGQQAALESAEAVHEALSAQADAAARHRPQDPRLSGEPGTMLLNGAYLVESRRAAEFADAVTDLAGHHPALRLTLTGPWPPYTFTDLDIGPGANQPEPQR